jgi:ribonuclease HIII
VSVKPAYKTKIASPVEKNKLKQLALGWAETQWDEKPEQYCDYRLDGKHPSGWVRIKQFTNGTLYIEAATPQGLVALMGVILPKEPLPQELFTEATNTTGALPVSSSGERGKLDIKGAYIGTDESGKGDYFGPLVIAGVLVNDETGAKLIELGVMDSKKLNDAAIQKLSLKILETVGSQAVSVVEIGPEKYNDLYNRFKTNGKNLNHLLAWGHAKVIENLLGLHPDCTQAIADQFGNESYIKNQLQEKGRGITLIQTPKAEANIGVAAASIIARNRFVQKLRRLGEEMGISLPLGAGSNVLTTGKRLVQEQGKASLTKVAKLHFKTTEQL